MKTTKSILLLTGLTLMALFASCNEKAENATTTTATKETEVSMIETQKVIKADLDQDFQYSATVQPYKKNSIAPAQPNRIMKMFVEVGDKVKKGQLLAKMDATSVNQQKMQIANLEKDLSRVEELVQVGGASKQQLDQIKVQVDVAKEALTLTEENTNLVSPIDGAITVRNYYEGDMTSAQQPIFVVMQIRPVKLLINLSERQFNMIKVGLPVSVTTEVYGSEVFAGKVSLIHPTIDEASRTFWAEITVPNDDLRVRPGMYAKVNINFGTTQVLAIPDAAVLRQPGSDARYLFVSDNGVARYRAIKTGRRMGSQYEVLSGVEEGEKVIVKGNARLTDGKAIAEK